MSSPEVVAGASPSNTKAEDVCAGEKSSLEAKPTSELHPGAPKPPIANPHGTTERAWHWEERDRHATSETPVRSPKRSAPSPASQRHHASMPSVQAPHRGPRPCHLAARRAGQRRRITRSTADPGTRSPDPPPGRPPGQPTPPTKPSADQQPHHIWPRKDQIRMPEARLRLLEGL